MKPIILTSFIVCLAAATTGATQEVEAERPAPCSSPQAHQFDFWIGEWTVTANGKVTGTNKISRGLGGCLLLEEYTGKTGYAGKSFNFYDETSSKWNQVWVDNTGVILRLRGEFADGKMVLSGSSKRGGETIVDRITWQENPDGTVRQVWDISKSGGESWETVFDGLYTRRTMP